jgi:hypothetical protein
MKSACINVTALSRLNGLIEGNKFLSEAFKDRIDTGRKQTVIACFKLRDLGPQPVYANLAVSRSIHNHVLGTGSLAAECHNVLAAIVLIWELTGHKASFIAPLLS